MIRQLKTIAVLALLLGLSLPSLAQEAAGQEQPIPDEDTILGTWHVQFGEDGEIVPEGESLRLVFEDNGVAKGYMNDGEAEVWRYEHDKARSVLTLYDAEDAGDIEVVLKYQFIDDILVFEFSERGDGETQRMELTRAPEGNERHQAMRRKASRVVKPGERRMSIIRLRELMLAALAVAEEGTRDLPASVGELVLLEKVPANNVLATWSETTLPEDYSDWSRDRQSDWINTHTGFVFVLAGENLGRIEDASERLAAFEMPAEFGPDDVAVVYADDHAATLTPDDADALLKQQTGHGLAEWAKTASPGTGKLVLPEPVGDGVVEDAVDPGH